MNHVKLNKDKTNKKKIRCRLYFPLVFAAIIAFILYTIQLINFTRENENPNMSTLSSETNIRIAETNSLPSKKSSRVLSPDLTMFQGDTVFDELLSEGKEILRQNPTITLHSMEVGMFNALQCLRQAKFGFEAHCIEPSPTNVKRIKRQFARSEEEQRKRVKFYPFAAGETSGIDVEFMSAGGTGDHVGSGEYNVWTMTKGDAVKYEKDTNTVSVKTVAIDDIISNKVQPTLDYSKESSVNSSREQPIDRLFMLKVDVQGFEPAVFSGLKDSIRNQKVDLIMTEFWPKGIDFMNDSMGPLHECKKPVEILKLMLDAGYSLYPLSIVAHPKAPDDGSQTRVMNCNRGFKFLPMNTLQEYCMSFYDFERKYRDGDGKVKGGDEVYEMGYWTDVLAVRSGLKLPGVSEVGKRLMSSLMRD